MKRLYQGVFAAVVVWNLLSFSVVSSQDDSPPKAITANNLQNLAEIAVLGQGIINDVQWSHDGRVLAASTTLGIWLFATHSPYEIDEALEPRLLDGGGDIAFSPDNNLLVSGSLDAVYVWDMTDYTHRLTQALEGSKFYFAFSGDSKYLAATSYQYETEWPVMVWSLDNNQLTEVARIPAQDIHVAALALNSDGSLLGMVDSSGVVHLILLPDGNELSSAETTYMVYRGARLTFSADDRRLLAHIMDVAANSVPLDGIYLWDVEALRSGASDTAQLYAIDTSNVWAEPVFSHDQSLLALHAGLDFVVLLDTETGQERGRLRSSTTPCHLAFGPDDSHVVAVDACDGAFWIWNTEQALEYGPWRVTLPDAIEPDVDTAHALVPNFSLPAPELDGRSPILNGHQQPVSAVFFSPDSQQVISHAADGTTRVWDAATHEQVSLITHDSGYGGISAVSRDGGVFVNAPWSGDIELWELSSGHLIRALEGHTGHINAVAFSPSGEMLASGSERYSADEESSLRLWNVQTGKDQILQQDESYVKTLAFSPDGRWLVSGSTGLEHQNLQLWDANTGELRYTLGEYSAVSGVAFSPDGSLLAVSSESSSIDLWDMSAGEPPITMTLNADDDHAFGLLAFSPDGTLLVSGGDKRIAVWKVTSGELLISADLPDTITSLAFAPDGTLIAFGLRDGTIRLWGIPQ